MVSFLYTRDASGNTGHKMLYIQHTVIIQQRDNIKSGFAGYNIDFS